MLYSELVNKGWNKWIMSTQFSKIGEDAQGDILVGSGWQTWSNKILNKDEEGHFTMIWCPFNDTLSELVNAEGDNKNFDKTVSDTAYFNTYYHGPHSSGKPIEYAGFVQYTSEPVIDDETNEEIGQVITDIVFDEALYDRYVDTIPCRNPATIESKAREADSKVAQNLAEGFVPNSVNMATTFLSIDGSETPETMTFPYDTAMQAELLKAFTACRAGLKNYTITLPGKKATKLPAQVIYMLYLEAEAQKAHEETYAQYYKEYLYSRINEGKDKEEEISAIQYGIDLPEPYNSQFEAEFEERYAELQELREVLIEE